MGIFRDETGCDDNSQLRMVSVKLDLLTLTELLANLKGVSLLEEFSGNELKFSSKC